MYIESNWYANTEYQAASYTIASAPGHSQILSRSCGEKAWDQNYVTDRKLELG